MADDKYMGIRQLLSASKNPKFRAFQPLADKADEADNKYIENVILSASSLQADNNSFGGQQKAPQNCCPLVVRRRLSLHALLAP